MIYRVKIIGADLFQLPKIEKHIFLKYKAFVNSTTKPENGLQNFSSNP